MIQMTGSPSGRLPMSARRGDAADAVPAIPLPSLPASSSSTEVRPMTDEQAARYLAEADGRRYRFLAKAIPQIIWTATPEGRIDSFNPRWAEFTGAEVSPEGHDRDWVAALHPEDVRRWLEGWTRARRSGTSLTIDLRLRRHDGTFRWHLARALPVLDRPDHSIRKWLGTCTDIDDQKRAEGMLGFLAEVSTVLASSLDYETTLSAVARLAVPHVADWCVVDMVEPDGGLRRLAVAHADPAQVDLGWWVGRHFPPDPGDAVGVAAVLRTGRPEVVPRVDAAHLDRLARTPIHRSILAELGLKSTIIVPLKARDRTIGVISLAMAGSGRAYSPADLSLVEDLARRAALAVDNARLYREAQQARAEAEAANLAKDRFLAVLGHELRTPLTPVLAEVSELLADPGTPDGFRPVLEMIRRNVALEARLIDDLLDLSRIARGKLQLRRERVDLHDVVGQALGVCRSGFAEARLAVAVHLDAKRHHVDADPDKLQQILWNLLKNATKFTPPGGSITVRTRDGADGRVLVAVTDTGAGIAPEALGRIFQPFDQGDPATTQRFGGLGLGLAIGHGLARAHDGRLRAESAGADLGATFTLELPTVDPPVAPAPSAPPDLRPRSTVAPARSLRVLFVEDDADTRLVLARLFRRRGHEVGTAGTVAEALDLARLEPFDALVCDLGLPDGTGHDFLRQLGPDRPARAIALSGSGLPDDFLRSRAAGFDEHLVKPIDFPALEAALHRPDERKSGAMAAGPGA